MRGIFIRLFNAGSKKPIIGRICKEFLAAAALGDSSKAIKNKNTITHII